MPKFQKIHFGAIELADATAQPRLRSLSRTGPGIPAFEAAPPELESRLSVSTAEAAGRLFLETYLTDSGSEAMAALTSPQSPQVIPDLQLERVSPVPALSAENVAFQQTYRGIPVFSGRITVDVDSDSRRLVSINGSWPPFPRSARSRTSRPATRPRGLPNGPGRRPMPFWQRTLRP